MSKPRVPQMYYTIDKMVRAYEKGERDLLKCLDDDDRRYLEKNEPRLLTLLVRISRNHQTVNAIFHQYNINYKIIMP